jgi:hypothetical protein
MNLLPLLRLSVSPRVISVLGAGSETLIDPKNLDGINKAPVFKAIGPAVTMTSLLFEEFASENPTISFIHTSPGMVSTQIMNHFFANAPGVWWPLAQVPRFTILPLFKKLVFISADEAGERTLFVATSARYPPAVDHKTLGKLGGWVERPAGVTVARSTVMQEGVGNGVYRTDWTGNEQKESKALNTLREEGVGKAVLKHTLHMFETALSKVVIGN